MSSAFSSPLRSLFTWIGVCVATFFVLNAYATRPIPVYVEQFRAANMDDEQVLTEALQAAKQLKGNDWWINEARPYLVFQSGRQYRIDPSFLSLSDLEITRDGQTLVGRFKTVPAVVTP